MMNEQEKPESRNIIISREVSGQVAIGQGITQVANAAPSYTESHIQQLSPAKRAALTRIHRGLRAHFDESELRDLCFDLGVDYEALPGQSKADKSRELVLYFERRATLHELVAACTQLRPNFAWSKLR